jgi:hypothetical protein
LGEANRNYLTFVGPRQPTEVKITSVGRWSDRWKLGDLTLTRSCLVPRAHTHSLSQKRLPDQICRHLTPLACWILPTNASDDASLTSFIDSRLPVLTRDHWPPACARLLPMPTAVARRKLAQNR